MRMKAFALPAATRSARVASSFSSSHSRSVVAPGLAPTRNIPRMTYSRGAACGAVKREYSADERARFADLLRRPILTETTTRAIEENKYTFEVSRASTKNEVKQAVETLFNVKVLQVNTVNPPVKRKRSRLAPGRQMIRRRGKRATVTLREGDDIPLFDDDSEEGEDAEDGEST